MSEIETGPDANVSETDKRVSENLRRFRLAAGISLLSLAKALGVSHQLIAKFEQGSIRIAAGHLPVIVQVLGISIDDLFTHPTSIGGPGVSGRRIVPFMTDAAAIADRQHLEALAAVTRALAEASVQLREKPNTPPGT